MYTIPTAFYTNADFQVDSSQQEIYETSHISMSSTINDPFEELVHDEDFVAMAEAEFKDRKKNPDNYISIVSLLNKS